MLVLLPVSGIYLQFVRHSLSWPVSVAAAPVTAHEVCGGGRQVRLLFDSTVVQVGAVTNIKRPTKLFFEV